MRAAVCLPCVARSHWVGGAGALPLGYSTPRRCRRPASRLAGRGLQRARERSYTTLGMSRRVCEWRNGYVLLEFSPMLFFKLPTR